MIYLMINEKWSKKPLFIKNVNECSKFIKKHSIQKYLVEHNNNCNDKIDFDEAKKILTDYFIRDLTGVDGFCEKSKILWVKNSFFKNSYYYFNKGEVKHLSDSYFMRKIKADEISNIKERSVFVSNDNCFNNSIINVNFDKKIGEKNE